MKPQAPQLVPRASGSRLDIQPKWIPIDYAVELTPTPSVNAKRGKIESRYETVIRSKVQKGILTQVIVYPSVLRAFRLLFDPRKQAAGGGPFEAGVVIAPHAHVSAQRGVVRTEALDENSRRLERPSGTDDDIHRLSVGQRGKGRVNPAPPSRWIRVSDRLEIAGRQFGGEPI